MLQITEVVACDEDNDPDEEEIEVTVEYEGEEITLVEEWGYISE